VPFWNRSPTPRYSLFHGADLHGSEKCFRKFVNAGKFYRVDALILGGDVTGKALVPLVRLEDGSYEARFLGRTEIARDEKELVTLEGQIRFNGFYPFRTDSEELGQLAADPVRREEHFQRVISAAVRQWVALADERLQGTGVACLVMPGNDDGEFVGEILSEGRTSSTRKAARSSLGRIRCSVTAGRTSRPGTGPANCRRISSRRGSRPHVRPRIRSADDLQPPASIWDPDRRRARDPRDLSLVGGSSATMVPVGSTAVRRVLERHARCSACTGISTSREGAPGWATVCLNPGSDYNTGILKGVIVRLRGSDVEDVQFVASEHPSSRRAGSPATPAPGTSATTIWRLAQARLSTARRSPSSEAL
jgi:Icc-related predicted phosphoesterase